MFPLPLSLEPSPARCRASLRTQLLVFGSYFGYSLALSCSSILILIVSVLRVNVEVGGRSGWVSL